MQDHLLEVLRPGLAERVFSDGEYLIRQGDQGTHLLYILEGTVEVLLKLSNPRNDRRSAHITACPPNERINVKIRDTIA